MSVPAVAAALRVPVSHASALAAEGRGRRHVVLLAAMPLAVGAATAVRGDTMAALVSALMGGFGLVLHNGSRLGR